MAQVILEIPGVEGECQLEGFKKMIVCESLSHDMEIEIEMSSNARRTVHVPTISNFVIARKWDLASPGLIKSILRAAVDTNAWKIHCVKGLGEAENMQAEFLTVELEKPILAKYGLEVSEGDTTENIEINAVVVSWTYSMYDDKQSKTGTKSVKFDTLSGKLASS